MPVRFNPFTSSFDLTGISKSLADNTYVNLTGDVMTGQLKIAVSGDAGYTFSSGGAFFINNTSNIGAGVNIYSNAGVSAVGHLFQIQSANTGYPTSSFYLDHKGTSHALVVNNQGTGTSNNALNIVSSNPSDSTIGVSGAETGRGTIKITHTGTGTDANASAISINLTGTGTRSQGIFIDSNTGTIGKLLNIRNSGTELFVVSSNGSTTIGSSFYLDTSTQMFGILNSSPSYNLDVSGSGRFTGEFHLSGSALSDSLFIENSTDATSGTTTRSSPVLKFRGKRWNGSSSDNVHMNIYQNVYGTGSNDNQLAITNNQGVLVTIINNNGDYTFASPSATAGATTKSSPVMRVQGQAWDGSASQRRFFEMFTSVWGTGSTSYSFYLQNASFTPIQIIDPNGDFYIPDVAKISWGSAGVFGADTNLYRGSANNLKTDDTFDAFGYKVGGVAGATDTFTTADGKTVTVTKGIVTSIV